MPPPPKPADTHHMLTARRNCTLIFRLKNIDWLLHFMPRTVLGAKDKVACESLYSGLGSWSLLQKAQGFATLASGDARRAVALEDDERGWASTGVPSSVWDTQGLSGARKRWWNAEIIVKSDLSSCRKNRIRSTEDLIMPFCNVNYAKTIHRETCWNGQIRNTDNTGCWWPWGPPTQMFSHLKESQMASTANLLSRQKLVFFYWFFFLMLLFICYIHPKFLLNYKTLHGGGGQKRHRNEKEKSFCLYSVGRTDTNILNIEKIF